jgi:hypothetical protein
MLDVTHAPATGASRNLRESLEQGVADSLDLQLLRRTLKLETPETTPAPAPEDTEAEPLPEAAPQPFDASLVARTELSLQQRELELEVTTAPPQQSDPLVLDLAGNGLRTRGLLDPVSFDLNADGRLDQISAPTGDDALLALDRNGNGRIDDGRELFGDQQGAANGFSELARFDDNADAWLDATDPGFTRLRLQRVDAAGQQQLQALGDAGVARIALDHRNSDLALGAYDRIAQLGSFQFTDGRQGLAADLLLAHR